MSFEEFYSITQDVLEELNLKVDLCKNNVEDCKSKFLKSQNDDTLTGYMLSLEMLHHLEGEVRGVKLLFDKLMKSLT